MARCVVCREILIEGLDRVKWDKDMQPYCEVHWNEKWRMLK
jgi:hypothetical protein